MYRLVRFVSDCLEIVCWESNRLKSLNARGYTQANLNIKISIATKKAKTLAKFQPFAKLYISTAVCNFVSEKCIKSYVSKREVNG